MDPTVAMLLEAFWTHAQAYCTEPTGRHDSQGWSEGMTRAMTAPKQNLSPEPTH